MDCVSSPVQGRLKMSLNTDDGSVADTEIESESDEEFVSRGKYRQVDKVD